MVYVTEAGWWMECVVVRGRRFWARVGCGEGDCSCVEFCQGYTPGEKKDERGRMWTEVDGSERKLTISGRRLLAGTSVWRATVLAWNSGAFTNLDAGDEQI